MVQKRYAFNRNLTLNSECWSFSGLVMCDVTLSPDAGQWQRQLPVSNHEGKQQSVCTQTSILFFTFSAVFNKLHETLYYKTGFMLDDFAQLWASVRVLSMFKVD